MNGLVLLDLWRSRRETWWFGRGLFRGWEVKSRLESGSMKTLRKLFGREKIVKLRTNFSPFACVFGHNGCIKVTIQHVVQSIMMPMMRLAIGLWTKRLWEKLDRYCFIDRSWISQFDYCYKHFVFGFHGHSINENVKTLITKYYVGNIILMKRNIRGPVICHKTDRRLGWHTCTDALQTLSLVMDLQELAKQAGHERPLMIGIDQENGELVSDIKRCYWYKSHTLEHRIGFDVLITHCWDSVVSWIKLIIADIHWLFIQPWCDGASCYRGPWIDSRNCCCLWPRAEACRNKLDIQSRRGRQHQFSESGYRWVDVDTFHHIWLIINRWVGVRSFGSGRRSLRKS